MTPGTGERRPTWVFVLCPFVEACNPSLIRVGSSILGLQWPWRLFLNTRRHPCTPSVHEYGAGVLTLLFSILASARPRSPGDTPCYPPRLRPPGNLRPRGRKGKWESAQRGSVLLTPRKSTALGARPDWNYTGNLDTEGVLSTSPSSPNAPRTLPPCWTLRAVPAFRAREPPATACPGSGPAAYSESGYNPKAVSRPGRGHVAVHGGTAHKYGLTVDWWIVERSRPVLSTTPRPVPGRPLGKFGDWYRPGGLQRRGRQVQHALEKTTQRLLRTLRQQRPARGKAKLMAETCTSPQINRHLQIFQTSKCSAFPGWTGPAPRSGRRQDPRRAPTWSTWPRRGPQSGANSRPSTGLHAPSQPPGVEYHGHLPGKLERPRLLANPSPAERGLTCTPWRGSTPCGRSAGVTACRGRAQSNENLPRAACQGQSYSFQEAARTATSPTTIPADRPERPGASPRAAPIRGPARRTRGTSPACSASAWPPQRPTA